MSVRSYGNSTKPFDPTAGSVAHSKRELAKDIVATVDALFGADKKLIPYGHDRGGRVAYRLSLDFPGRVAGTAVLDIVPGVFVWEGMRLDNNFHAETKKSHHWVRLSLVQVSLCLVHANSETRWTACMRILHPLHVRFFYAFVS